MIQTCDKHLLSAAHMNTSNGALLAVLKVPGFEKKNRIRFGFLNQSCCCSFQALLILGDSQKDTKTWRDHGRSGAGVGFSLVGLNEPTISDF